MRLPGRCPRPEVRDRVTLKRTEIYYTEQGDGQPIVMSHGWPLNSDAWQVELELFADAGYRAIAHDRRGHGRFSKTQELPTASVARIRTSWTRTCWISSRTDRRMKSGGVSRPARTGRLRSGRTVLPGTEPAREPALCRGHPVIGQKVSRSLSEKSASPSNWPGNAPSTSSHGVSWNLATAPQNMTT